MLSFKNIFNTVDIDKIESFLWFDLKNTDLIFLIYFEGWRKNVLVNNITLRL